MTFFIGIDKLIVFVIILAVRWARLVETRLASQNVFNGRVLPPGKKPLLSFITTGGRDDALGTERWRTFFSGLQSEPSLHQVVWRFRKALLGQKPRRSSGPDESIHGSGTSTGERRSVGKMTTLSELADEALAVGRMKVFFRIEGSRDTYRVHLSRHGNPKSFVVFNSSTNVPEEIAGSTEVERAGAPISGWSFGV